MIGEMLIRIEKLEDAVQDLNEKLEHLSTGIIILIRKIEPEVYKELFDDLNDDNVS